MFKRIALIFLAVVLVFSFSAPVAAQSTKKWSPDQKAYWNAYIQVFKKAGHKDFNYTKAHAVLWDASKLARKEKKEIFGLVRLGCMYLILRSLSKNQTEQFQLCAKGIELFSLALDRGKQVDYQPRKRKSAPVILLRTRRVYSSILWTYSMFLDIYGFKPSVRDMKVMGIFYKWMTSILGESSLDRAVKAKLGL